MTYVLEGLLSYQDLDMKTDDTIFRTIWEDLDGEFRVDAPSKHPQSST